MKMKKGFTLLMTLLLLAGLSAGNMTLAVKEFDVDGITKSIENQPGFVNDTDPRIVYKGPWSRNQYTPAGGVATNGGRDWTAAYAGGGRAYLGEVKGASVEFTFVGTSITVLMTRYTDLGSVEFVLDGQAPVRADLDCQASEADDNYAAFKKSGLSSGTHTIKMTSVEMPNKDGDCGWIHLIGFVTDNGVINSTNKNYVDAQGFTVNTEADPNQMSTCCVGDDLLVSTKSGSTATFTFEGSYVALLSKVAKGYGTASVSIDGKAAGDISLDAGKTEIQKMVFAQGGLSKGKHTLVLTTKSNAVFNIDALIVDQTTLTAPTTSAPPKATVKPADNTPANSKPTAANQTTAGTAKKTTATNRNNQPGTTAGSAPDTASSSPDVEPQASGPEGSEPGESTDQPEETAASTSGQGTQPVSGTPGSGNRTAITVVVVIMVVLLLGIGGAAAWVLYFKPKMAAKKNEEG